MEVTLAIWLSTVQVGESVSAGLPIDFWTIDLRAALLALGEVSGDEVGEVAVAMLALPRCLGMRCGGCGAWAAVPLTDSHCSEQSSGT